LVAFSLGKNICRYIMCLVVYSVYGRNFPSIAFYLDVFAVYLKNTAVSGAVFPGNIGTMRQGF